MELINKIQVIADPLLEKRRQAGVDMRDTTRDGGYSHQREVMLCERGRGQVLNYGG